MAVICTYCGKTIDYPIKDHNINQCAKHFRDVIVPELEQEIERLKAQVAHLEGMLSESANLGETSMGTF